MQSRLAAGLVAGIAALVCAASAHAANVTIHVEGGSGVVVPPTVVQTGPFTVTKDGQNSCSGTTAAGALERGTGGDWNGEFSFGSYIARRIHGEDYPQTQDDYFWGFAVDGVIASSGMCGVELADGQEVLFYKACYLATSGCFDGTVLRLTAPAQAAPGKPVTVSVEQVVTTFDSGPPYGSHGTRSPASGVTVSGGGATATTGADGSATLTPSGRGPVTLRATRGANVPDQADVCVTDGADGHCSTTVPAPAPPAACRTSGDDGFCGTPDRRAGFGVIRSLKEGQRFRRGRGPRELAGSVDAEAAIARVDLRVTGRRGTRCSTYDAGRERMVTMRRCGASRGSWFAAGTSNDWTYLLPERLGSGRWVIDVRTTDRAGNVNRTLQRGRTRMVVHVG